MDKNEARKAAEVMLAYADGKKIEWNMGKEVGWVECHSPAFNWNDSTDTYRIKPQPKYRPFNSAEECWQEMQKHQPFGWMKDKADGHYGLYSQITLIDNKIDNYIIGVNSGWDSEGVFKHFTFADGEPFGVKEE